MYNINQDQDITSQQSHLIHNLQNNTDTFYEVTIDLQDFQNIVLTILVYCLENIQKFDGIKPDRHSKLYAM